MCDRRVNVHRLSGFFFLLFRFHKLQCTHIMKTVRQFYNDNTDIFCHRQKHFTKIFRLHIQFVRGIVQLGQFRNTIDQKCNLRTKHLSNVFHSIRCVLNDIMKKSADNRLLVHIQLCQNDCHTDRVNQIWFPGFSFLILMCFFGKFICFSYNPHLILPVFRCQQLCQHLK